MSNTVCQTQLLIVCFSYENIRIWTFEIRRRTLALNFYQNPSHHWMCTQANKSNFILSILDSYLWIFDMLSECIRFSHFSFSLIMASINTISCSDSGPSELKTLNVISEYAEAALFYPAIRRTSKSSRPTFFSPLIFLGYEINLPHFALQNYVFIMNPTWM